MTSNRIPYVQKIQSKKIKVLRNREFKGTAYGGHM